MKTLILISSAVFFVAISGCTSKAKDEKKFCASTAVDWLVAVDAQRAKNIIIDLNLFALSKRVDSLLVEKLIPFYEKLSRSTDSPEKKEEEKRIFREEVLFPILEKEVPLFVSDCKKVVSVFLDACPQSATRFTNCYAEFMMKSPVYIDFAKRHFRAYPYFYR